VDRAICQRCFQEYQPTSNNHKYCADCRPLVRYVRNHDWNKTHPERMRAAYTKWENLHPEKKKVIQNASQHRHPEQRRALRQKRRVAKYANTPINEMLTSAEWLQILVDANGHCAYCGKEAKLTMEHVIPLTRGGKHSKDNIVAVCGHCNSSKNARTLEEWHREVLYGNS
jgi:5-methylcytosine-specific restriction endonuclease McrA